jgi:hypothetical protein
MLLRLGGQPQRWPMDVVAAATMSHRCGCPARLSSINVPSLRLRHETGVIPFDKPSRHRKVGLDDLLEYRRRQRSQAELAFAEMVADTERLGLYDADAAQSRQR